MKYRLGLSQSGRSGRIWRVKPTVWLNNVGTTRDISYLNQTLANGRYPLFVSGASGVYLGLDQIAGAFTAPGTFTVYMNNAAITDLTNIAVTNTLQNITLTTPLVYPAAAYFEIEYTGTLGLDYHSVTSHVTS